MHKPQLTFDGHGINDKALEYTPRIATFQREYKEKEFRAYGLTMAASFDLLQALQVAIDYYGGTLDKDNAEETGVYNTMLRAKYKATGEK